jgi:ribosomal RNA-processing protein 9
MSSFFTVPSSQRKRKRADDRPGKPAKRRGVEKQSAQPERKAVRPREDDRDDSISGSDSDHDIDDAGSLVESEASSEEDETAAERRVRLAQRYLDNVREEVQEVGFDAKDLDDDLIARRLREDVDEAKGRQFRLIANKLDWTKSSRCAFRADTLSTTAVAVCAPFAYTVSKDKTLIKWRLRAPQDFGADKGRPGKKAHVGRRRPEQAAYVKGVQIRASVKQQHGHRGAIVAVAASPDGQFVVTGGQDKMMIVWCADDLRPLKTFTTHRDSVLGLAFAPSHSQAGLGQQLFSASADRSIKTYSLSGEESLAYVETLFGHQDHVGAVTAMAVDQCVSVGSRDRSARFWKVVDETQLKFLGDSSSKETYQTGSLDCVAALPPQHFVTGSDSGNISLWSQHKKKALFTIQLAHGVDDPPPFEDVTSEADPKVIEEQKKHDTRRPIPRAITALVTLPGTDIILSGSWDGWIRVWKLSDDKRSILSHGVLGVETEPHTDLPNGHAESEAVVNGVDHAPDRDETTSPESNKSIRGIINGLAVFERRKELKDAFGMTREGETIGLCIVAGTGKEPRLGRQMKIGDGRNGAVVFEVPLL